MMPGEAWFACPHTAPEVVRSWQVGDCRRKVRCVTVAVEGLAELAPETMGSVSWGKDTRKNGGILGKGYNRML